ncbi:MAG: hypothetical protein OXG55_08930 [bacterium]|nr:hypothetical protein [bacterium]
MQDENGSGESSGTMNACAAGAAIGAAQVSLMAMTGTPRRSARRTVSTISLRKGLNVMDTSTSSRRIRATSSMASPMVGMAVTLSTAMPARYAKFSARGLATPTPST